MGRKGKQRGDLRYRGWGSRIISFLVSFSFARGGGGEGGETRRTDIDAYPCARGSIEGDKAEKVRRNRERNEMWPEAKFHLTQLRQQRRRLGRPLTSTVCCALMLRVDLART